VKFFEFAKTIINNLASHCLMIMLKFDKLTHHGSAELASD